MYVALGILSLVVAYLVIQYAGAFQNSSRLNEYDKSRTRALQQYEVIDATFNLDALQFEKQLRSLHYRDREKLPHESEQSIRIIEQGIRELHEKFRREAEADFYKLEKIRVLINQIQTLTTDIDIEEIQQINFGLQILEEVLDKYKPERISRPDPSKLDTEKLRAGIVILIIMNAIIWTQLFYILSGNSQVSFAEVFGVAGGIIGLVLLVWQAYKNKL